MNIKIISLFLVTLTFTTTAAPAGRPANIFDIREAAINGNSALLEELLTKNPHHVNGRDEKGLSPLFYATWHGHLECLKILLNYGANINAKNSSDWAALDDAAWTGHLDCLQELINRGAFIESRNIYDGRTPLHLAAQHGHLDCVKELVQHGANIEAQEINGKTPAMLAAKEGYYNIVNYLNATPAERAEQEVRADFSCITIE